MIWATCLNELFCNWIEKMKIVRVTKKQTRWKSSMSIMMHCVKSWNKITEFPKIKMHPKTQPQNDNISPKYMGPFFCVLYFFTKVWTVEIVKSAKTTKDANELIQQSRSCCHSGTQVQNEKEWSLIWTADDSLFFHLLVVYRDCVVTLRTHIRLWEVPFSWMPKGVLVLMNLRYFEKVR